MEPTTAFMAALREAVQDRHARMEALPFIQALAGGVLPQASYLGQLRAMAVLHATLEHELGQLGPGGPLAPFAARPSRLANLRSDLDAFGPLALPDCGGALPPILRAAARFRLHRVQRPTDLLGALYVLEGMTLGNRVHLPEVLAAFGGEAHYYAGYGAGTSAAWRGFGGLMEAVPLGDGDRDGAIQAALELFADLEEALTALHPLRASGARYTATQLNPEAGDHPVPQDAGELQAALAAGARCRAAFPYLDERYQERGRGFSRSDAAWLVTLAALSPAQVVDQTEWLGRVLSSRGMPRLILERQLELLHEELAARGHPTCGVLLEAAANLRRERLLRLPEPHFTQLAEAFRLATDDELRGRFRGTGALLAAAVCDRDAGFKGAVTSLLPWLTEPGRFPPAWCEAAARTCLEAEQALARSPR